MYRLSELLTDTKALSSKRVCTSQELVEIIPFNILARKRPPSQGPLSTPFGEHNHPWQAATGPVNKHSACGQI